MKSGFGIFTALAILWPLYAAAEEPTVARAQFTSAMIDREPADNLTSIGVGAARAYFFTELRNMDGQTVTHRWTYNGEVKASVEFNVRGPRWRVHSSKNMTSEWTGDWTVDVLDGSGNVVATRTLTHTGD